MSEGKVTWLCARCARKRGVETEANPVIHGYCTDCKIKNWVRPLGHGGADVPTEEAESNVRLILEDGEEVPVEEAPFEEIEAETVEEKLEEVAEAIDKAIVASVIAKEEPALTEAEKKIAELKAELARLEGE